MNNSAALVIGRRLAIQLLHEAQIAAPGAITGVVGALEGEPVSFLRGARDLRALGQDPWAQVFSNPLAPAVPTAAELQADTLTLVISLNTKGVLEMRAWSLTAGEPQEHVLSIRD